VTATIERQAGFENHELVAAALVGVLDHFEAANGPRAVQEIIVQGALAAHVVLLGLEIASGEQFPVEIAVALERMQAAGEAR
jgi:hypothetical protein